MAPAFVRAPPPRGGSPARAPLRPEAHPEQDEGVRHRAADLGAPRAVAEGPGVVTDVFPRVPRRASILVFFAALLPRLWALDWAFPLKTGHIDEAVVVFYSLHARPRGREPPGLFRLPRLFPLRAGGFLLQGSFVCGRSRGTGGAAARVGDPRRPIRRGTGWGFPLGGGAVGERCFGRFDLRRAAAGRSDPLGLFRGAVGGALVGRQPLGRPARPLRHGGRGRGFPHAPGRRALGGLLGGTARPATGFWAAALIGLGAATKYYLGGPGSLPSCPGLFAGRGPRAPGGARSFWASDQRRRFPGGQPLLRALGGAVGTIQRFALLFPKIIERPRGGRGDVPAPHPRGACSPMPGGLVFARRAGPGWFC